MSAETQNTTRPPRDPRFEDWTERLSPTLYIRFTRGPDYEDAFLCIDDGEPDMRAVARMSFTQARMLQAAMTERVEPSDIERTAAPDLAEFGTDADELRARRNFMVSRGYRFCSIPACNCNSWHGGHSEARLQELDDLLDHYGVERDGKTLLGIIEAVIQTAGYTAE